MSLLGLYLGETDVRTIEMTDDELDGVIGEVSSLGKADPKRRKFVRKIKAARKAESSRVVSTNNLTGKAEMELRSSMLPDNIQAGLKNGTLQLVDDAIYSIKDISAQKQVELMENKDDKTSGLTNVNGRKLDANKYFLVTGIQLLSGVYTTTVDDATFAVPVAGIINGEFELNVGGKIIVPQLSNSKFDTTNRTDVLRGYFKLENPKLIAPQTEIIPEIKLPAAAAVKTAVKVVLHGVSVAKA